MVAPITFAMIEECCFDCFDCVGLLFHKSFPAQDGADSGGEMLVYIAFSQEALSLNIVRIRFVVFSALHLSPALHAASARASADWIASLGVAPWPWNTPVAFIQHTMASHFPGL